MPDKPKNKLSVDEIVKFDHSSARGKTETVEDIYKCDNYIEAINLKKTLETITCKGHVIENCGPAGWKVVVKR